MRRRLLAAVMSAALVAGLAIAMPLAGAQEIPETNLDLVIDPNEGPPGTDIDTFVPPEQALEVCVVDPDELVADIEAILGDLQDATGDQIVFLLLGFLEEELPGIVEPNFALLFPLLFVDIVTQEPLAEDLWNPVTGEGQITAPEEPFDIYAVVAACIGLAEIDIEATAELLEDVLADQLAAIGACIEEPTMGCSEIISGGVETVGGVLLTLLLDPDDPNIVGLGFELYCLGDEAFCAEPLEDLIPEAATPATPITEAPRFTG